MTDEQEQEPETYSIVDAERIEAALEELWARGAKTMINIPVPATGEVRVVRRHGVEDEGNPCAPHASQ